MLAMLVGIVVLKDKPECRGSSESIPNEGLGTYGTLRFTGKEEPNLKCNIYIYNIYDIIVFLYYEKKLMIRTISKERDLENRKRVSINLI